VEQSLPLIEDLTLTHLTLAKFEEMNLKFYIKTLPKIKQAFYGNQYGKYT
jgi:hypothetical protein